MAFSRARLKRFNEIKEQTPGVGAYNLAKDKQVKDKAGSLTRINESLRDSRDKALVAVEKGTLPKHVEEIHTKLAHAQERVVDLEILKMAWEKQRQITEKDKEELKQKLTKLESIQEKFSQAESDRHDLEKQIKNFTDKISNLEQQLHDLQSQLTETEKKKESVEKEKLQLTTELNTWANKYTDLECISDKQVGEIKELKENLTDVQSELDASKEENACYKAKDQVQTQDFEEKMVRLEEAHLLKILELEREAHQLQQRMNQLRLEVAVMDELKEVLEGEKLQLSTELETLTNKCMELESMVEKHSAEMAELKSNLSEAQSQLRASKKECEFLGMREQEKTQEFEVKLASLEETHLALKNESSDIAEDLSSKLVICEEEKKNLECEKLEVATKLEQALEDVEELTQHVFFTQDKLKTSTEEFDLFKETHEKASEEFENEKQFLTSQIQSLIIKCEECEEKLKRTTEINAEEMELLRNQNAEKILEVEDEKKMLGEKMDEFENNKREMLTQEHRLNERLVELEKAQTNLETKSSSLAQDLTKQLINREGRIKELEAESDDLLQKLEFALEKAEMIEAKSKEALEQVQASYSEDMMKVEMEKKNVQQKQEDLWKCKLSVVEEEKQQLESRLQTSHEKIKELEESNNHVLQKFEYALEKADMIESINKEALAEAQASYAEELAKVDMENKIIQQRQEDKWEKELFTVEEEKRQLESSLKNCEGKVKELEANNDQVLRKFKNALENAAVIESRNKEVLEQMQAMHSEDLARVEIENKTIQQKQEEIWMEKISAVEEEKRQLESEVNVAKEEIVSFTNESNDLQTKCDEIMAQNEKLTRLLSQAEGKLGSMKQEPAALSEHEREEIEEKLATADHEIEVLTNIISEMSDKIEQFECERGEILTELDESREKYEHLMKKMEPFRGVLDEFEQERQLLYDKDKYTTEQLEKLTQECIKNMGHQNHKQRIKYLQKLKQENLNLDRTVRELEDQVHRQDATIKKLKEKSMDKTEKPVKPRQRTPLKEGNRL